MMKLNKLSLPAEIVIGKDILELVSSSMYIDPLTIYREYIQNAADSIDDARAAGIIKADELGRVDITLDVVGRSVKVRDNGVGLSNGEFVKRLTSLGGSQKRGTSARGFRGVGRLAGLGYCQELIFRSRAAGDRVARELRWDCRKLKKLLSDHSYEGGVNDIIRDVVTVVELDSDEWPEHFYEVELVKPIRIKNDLLLNRDEIALYLSQVVPVPFSPKFKFGAAIASFLREHLTLGEIELYIDGGNQPLCRPYRDSYGYGDGKRDAFTAPEFHVIEGLNGGVAAAVWILHHGYLGAIPNGEGVNGLRVRKGNFQIGDHRIFSGVFPEARFASWTVGEVHVIDEKIIPNGRRDDFEAGAHYSHLANHLSAVGDRIARMCRSNSVVRNRIKAFDIGALRIDEQLKILEQGAVGEAKAEAIVENIRSDMFEVKKVADSPVLAEAKRDALNKQVSTLSRRLTMAEKKVQTSDAYAHLPEGEREIVTRMMGLIYECSTNRLAAKALVDRILARLGEG